MNSIITTTFSITSSLIYFYCVFLSLRFLFQYMSVDFNNRISQVILQITSPMLVHCRRIIPGYFGLDLANLVLIFCLLFIIGFINFFTFSNLFSIVIAIIITLKMQLFIFLDIFFYSALLYVVLSWLFLFGLVPPSPYPPIASIVEQLLAPILYRIRSRIPPISGIDLSVMLIILGVYIIEATINQIVFSLLF